MESAAKRYGMGIVDKSTYPVCRKLCDPSGSRSSEPDCVINFMEDRGVLGIVDELCKAYAKLRLKEREIERNKVATSTII